MRKRRFSYYYYYHLYSILKDDSIEYCLTLLEKRREMWMCFSYVNVKGGESGILFNDSVRIL